MMALRLKPPGTRLSLQAALQDPTSMLSVVGAGDPSGCAGLVLSTGTAMVHSPWSAYFYPTFLGPHRPDQARLHQGALWVGRGPGLTGSDF